MKILIDASLLAIGGGIQVGLAVLENAARTQGIEWHAVLSPNMDAQLKADVRSQLAAVHTVGGSKQFRFFNLPRRMSELESHVEPDMVFTVFGPSNWHAKSAHLQGFALPSVIYPEVHMPNLSLRERAWRAVHYQVKSRLARKCEYLVVETEVVRQRLHERLGIAADRIFVVKNSYSPSFRETLQNIHPDRHEDAFTFIVPSSYYRHKNLEFIPSVAAKLSQLVQRKIRFVFTLPEDGIGWARVKQAANAVGARGLVSTVGAVPHARFAQVYRNADAVFLPTLLECSSAVYPEAFLAEIPLATSDTDFAHALCGDAAMYADPRDPQRAAEALATVIRDSTRRESLVSAGRRVLESQYVTPEVKWHQQLECLMQVASKRPANLRVHAATPTIRRNAEESENAIAFHDQLAPDWERKYQKKSFKARETVLHECLNGKDLNRSAWLDAGCGTGMLSRLLVARGCSVVGIDAAPGMLRIASQQARAMGINGQLQLEPAQDIQMMQFSPNRFDGVLCNSVLEYLDRPEAALSNIANCLRPDGLLLISVPNRRSIVRGALRFAFYLTHLTRGRGWPGYLRFSKNSYTRRDFSTVLSSHDFELLTITSFGGPLPRWLQRMRFVGPLNMYVVRKRSAKDESGQA